MDRVSEGTERVRDAYHTFFDCDRWMAKKIALEAEVGNITPDNVVERMLQNEERWSAVARFVEDILRAKKTTT